MTAKLITLARWIVTGDSSGEMTSRAFSQMMLLFLARLVTISLLYIIWRDIVAHDLKPLLDLLGVTWLVAVPYRW